MSEPVPILMYHSIARSPNDATRALSVSPEAFAEQMALLDDRGFTPVATARLASSWRSGGPLPARPVLITFDDGYEGVHLHGLPALAKYGFASTLFVSTGWIRGAYDTGGGLDAMLDWDQVQPARRGADGDRRAQPHPSAARPDRGRRALVRAAALQGDHRRRTGRPPGLVRLPVRLLQLTGAPYGA